MYERIVITGMGTVNPLGNSVSESWENAINGVSGLAPITQFDASNHLVKYACEVKNFDATKYLEAREIRRRDRFEILAAAAVSQALEQSGLEINDSNAGRIGTVVSAAIGGLISLEEGVQKVHGRGPRTVSPFLIPMLMPNGAAGLVGIDHGPKGPAFSVASACASGQDGIGMAWMMLRSGSIDVAIAGASEAVISATGVAAFDRLGAMSRRSPEEGTPQPFDKNRDGLVMGEGSGAIILETESHAKARGAEILAELAGYGASADAFHITAPSDTGAGGSKAIQVALQEAGANAGDVDYINAHGTGTQLNDKSETLAVKSALGEAAYSTPISSTKSMTGHMMGATGALETIFCIQAIRENRIPPTINYLEADPDCDLDYVPNEGRDHEVDLAITNAFGFGGHNAVLAIRNSI